MMKPKHELSLFKKLATPLLMLVSITFTDNEMLHLITFHTFGVAVSLIVFAMMVTPLIMSYMVLPNEIHNEYLDITRKHASIQLHEFLFIMTAYFICAYVLFLNSYVVYAMGSITFIVVSTVFRIYSQRITR